MIFLPVALALASAQGLTTSQQLECKWDDDALPCEMKSTTAHYVVAVYNKCREGTEYTCKDYIYTSLNREGKRFTLLHGRMEYTLCADNLTPCRQTGWSFRNGDTEYVVEYPTGNLAVYQGKKLLMREEAITAEPQ